MKKLLAFLCTVLLSAGMCAGTVFGSTASDGFLDKLNGTDSAAPEESGYNAKTLYAMTAPKVVEILTYDASGEAYSRGTGFFINGNGTVVTNYHVIEASCSATVQTYDEAIYDVQRVLGYDPVIDLAILQIDLSGNEYLEMPSHEVKTGDSIYTLGSALGLTGTFSDGIVSTASREMDGVEYIQITAPISQGNSGGPLINEFGEVIGVNTWYFIDGQNVNFAVSIYELSRLDVSHPMTLAEVFEKEGVTEDNDTSSVSTDEDVEKWYAESDLAEIESNDSFGWSDYLRNDYLMAGCVDGLEDFDYFNIKVVAPADLSAILIPMYTEDCDYLLMAAATEDGDILGYAEQSVYKGLTIQELDVHFDAPGTYYLIVCVADEYPYSEPSYYQLIAEW